jgi:hypothetical protein
MDLRHIDWNSRELSIIHKSIAQRRFIYQPYILAEDLEIGEGMDFYDGYRPGRMGCIYWPDAPGSIGDLLVTDKDFFRKCNAEWRIHYDRFIDNIVEKCGGNIANMSFAEIGCNGGYFLFGLMLRGAAKCFGFDYTPFHDIFAVLNKRLGTSVHFQFSEWDSIYHRLTPADMPEVDIAICAAFLCHNPDPIYHLAYICDRAKKGVFIWTPVIECSEDEPPFAHWKTDLVMSFGTPRRHTDKLGWPSSFDWNMRLSVPLIKTCLREAGFEEIHELECPVPDPRWMEIYKGFRAFYAKRTREVKSLLSAPQDRRSRPATLQKVIDDSLEIEGGSGKLNIPAIQDIKLPFLEADAIYLIQLINNVKSEHKLVLEVGSWTSTGSVSEIIKILNGGRGLLYFVDNFRGCTNRRNHTEITESFDAFCRFMRTLERSGGLDVVKPLMMSSGEAAKVIIDGSMDLVFLDADHGYQAVHDDIRLWLPKIKPGGILCGRGCEVRAEALGLELLRTHRHQYAIAATGAFSQIHPGAILAVHEAFGNSINLASERALKLPNGAVVRSSIWWVQVR